MIANPNASGTTPAVRDVIAHALGAALKLDVVETERRHHATELARAAVADGYEVIVSLGGDGTLNEIVNGIAGSDVALIPLPGGGTNVFARTHGLPRDPVDATSAVLAHLEAGGGATPRHLGRVNGRAFTFCAGVGFDADVVRAVEARPRWKHRLGEIFFILTGVLRFFLAYPRRSLPMTLRTEAGETERIGQIFACMSDPYTFFRARPFRLCPDAGRERGLSLNALTSLSTFTALRLLALAFTSATHGRMRNVHLLNGIADASVRSDRPVPYQVDGDYAGEATTFTFGFEADAVRLLIPPRPASPADHH